MPDTEYIRIELFEQKPKTNVYEVLNISGDFPYIIGYIKWHGPWRQYCFFTDDDTIILSRGCMKTINDFITKLMEARKNDTSSNPT